MGTPHPFHQFGEVTLSYSAGEHSHRTLKRLDVLPAQPRRLFHPPALSLPRQTLCPWDAPCPKQGRSERSSPFFVLANFFSVLLEAREGQRRCS